MEFEWDERKNLANQAKHGVSFEQAVRIFEHPTLTAADDRFAYGEVRLISIGMISIGLMDDGQYLTVVHTERDVRIRIISARPSSRQERKRYEQALREALDRR